MSLLGIDIGTTHCKAGVFREDGKAVRIASRPTRTRQDGLGRYFYDPGELWETAAACIREVLKEGTQDVQSIGIASMAESGLLVDSRTGTAKTAFLPWFDSRSMDQAERIGNEADPYERFRITGLRSSYKYGLAKLLWLKEQDPDILNHAVWLSASDYAAYRLTGMMATDYSLAGRTFAFDINKREWDSSWIRHFGLNPDLFPAALPAGSRLGCVHSGASAETGLPPGTPVAIAGHDHVCAALAVGAVREGDVYVSAGTAETLVGILPDSELSQREYDSGLSYGLHAVQGQRFWMGGISASGGSVEWLRGLLGDDGLSYQELMGLLESGREEPTGILYFPYLSGSGAPWPDAGARAAFVGLTKAHGKADLLQAALEGTAYELEAIRRAAEKTGCPPFTRMTTVGGGTRNRRWMQIKADVTGCLMEVPAIEEATLLGASLTAAAGCGIYSDEREAAAAVKPEASTRYKADPERHKQYLDLYEKGYLALQPALRQFYHTY